MKKTNIGFEPIHKDLLYTKIADAIMQYIRENDLKNGDKIPSERELAQEFNTSRNSVREALRVLERDHIIEVKMGKGAFITSEKAETSFYLTLWKVNYLELLEIKGILELQIIESLCGKLTKEQIDSLREPLERMEQGASMGIFMMKEDYIFHSRLRKMYPNNTMEQLLDNLIKALDASGSEVKNAASVWRETVPYHRDILNAMIENKPFAAREALSSIHQIDKRVLETLMENKKQGESGC